MVRFSLTILLAASLQAASPYTGRWDLTIQSTSEMYPDWLEVTEDGGALAARVQPKDGSVHPVTSIRTEGSQLLVEFKWSGRTINWDLSANGNRLTGSQKSSRGESAQVTGVRAPALKRPMPKSWTKAEPIFNGKDLTGWKPMNPANSHWDVQDGVLVNVTKGSNLKTVGEYEDFKLHFELNCPDGGNSGFYLRGRYEIQIAYEKEPDNFHSMGSIYGMLAPSVEMPRKPGQWEAFDATLVGRWLTLVRDGKTIIDNQEIAGITGGALDSKEAEPGPFYIQGDHTGGMKYRNITISVPRK
ncbi:MAG: DUF1080 domain-containing protein [Acidobacteriia bacterium]|nr:DUF1080 domain-containing protein [Terriglobia bacterium]